MRDPKGGSAAFSTCAAIGWRMAPKLNLSRQKVFVLLVMPLVLMFGYSNCSFVPAPTASSSISSNAAFSFDHAGITSGCTACHGLGARFASLPPTGHVAIGTSDCSSCHTTTTWVSGANPHVAGAAIPSSCLTCHQHNIPSGPQGTPALLGDLTPSGGLFDHSGNGGNGDCVTCHTSVAANVGVTFAGGIFPHSPMPGACLGCHTASQRPTGPVGSSNFDHVAAGATGDCVACHNNPANVGKTWVAGTFSHTPTPSACANCHGADAAFIAIQKTVLNQMDHAFAGLPDCSSCHLKTAVTNGFTSFHVEAIANATSTDLTAKGIFHSGFGAASPPTCFLCHTGAMPKTTVPDTVDGFTHAAGFGTECSTCHAVVPGGVGVTWTKGFFGHANNTVSGLGNTCSPCHDTRHHHAGALCTTCHQGVTFPTTSPTGNYGGSFGSGGG